MKELKDLRRAIADLEQFCCGLGAAAGFGKNETALYKASVVDEAFTALENAIELMDSQLETADRKYVQSLEELAKERALAEDCEQLKAEICTHKMDNSVLASQLMSAKHEMHKYAVRLEEIEQALDSCGAPKVDELGYGVAGAARVQMACTEVVDSRNALQTKVCELTKEVERLRDGKHVDDSLTAALQDAHNFLADQGVPWTVTDENGFKRGNLLDRLKDYAKLKEEEFDIVNDQLKVANDQLAEVRKEWERAHEELEAAHQWLSDRMVPRGRSGLVSRMTWLENFDKTKYDRVGNELQTAHNYLDSIVPRDNPDGMELSAVRRIEMAMSSYSVKAFTAKVEEERTLRAKEHRPIPTIDSTIQILNDTLHDALVRLDRVEKTLRDMAGDCK